MEDFVMYYEITCATCHLELWRGYRNDEVSAEHIDTVRSSHLCQGRRT